MKLAKLILATTFMLFASTALAQSAVIENFDAQSTCIDEFGTFLLGQTSRHVVITNDGEGTINVSVKGICPTSSDFSIHWDNFDFNAGCSAGNAGVLPFWKYHMRPDGKYHLKCSSYPLGN